MAKAWVVVLLNQPPSMVVELVTQDDGHGGVRSDSKTPIDGSIESKQSLGGLGGWKMHENWDHLSDHVH